jgi:sugar-specific transcriptional regulator TrmB
MLEYKEEFNCLTNENTRLELTHEELQIELQRRERIANKMQEFANAIEAKENAKKRAIEKLQSLGLSEEEAQALLA